MPPQNRFRHQTYQSCRPTAPYELLRPDPPLATPDPEQWRMTAERLSAANVSAIYLMHGTFVGRDASGWVRKIGRLWPSAGASVERMVKNVMNGLAGDAGNYTTNFAREFEQSIAAHAEKTIPVKLFDWSGENLHIARANAAIRLLDELAHSDPPLNGRVLVWAHSHGGNALALLTNLLGADKESLENFFEACQPFFRVPFLRRTDMPAWPRVYDMLLHDRSKLSKFVLDLVTFGTPVRYGWDTTGYGKLLHFVNHRPQPGIADYLACVPHHPNEVLSATGGDYVQQFGIAGSNLLPDGLAWRTWAAEVRLHRVLQSGIRSRDILQNIRLTMRVPEEGTTLLVDYRDRDESFLHQVAGHAVYTRLAWLPFHASEVAKRFYASGG